MVCRTLVDTFYERALNGNVRIFTTSLTNFLSVFSFVFTLVASNLTLFAISTIEIWMTIRARISITIYFKVICYCIISVNICARSSALKVGLAANDLGVRQIVVAITVRLASLLGTVVAVGLATAGGNTLEITSSLDERVVFCARFSCSTDFHSF